jgi:DNA topoisomerase-6 subunit B
MAEKISRVTGNEPLDIDDTMARIMNNVLVERQRENGSVEVVVENNADTNADIEITDIVTAEPDGVEEGTVVEMDGEWFVKWSPTVGGGETATLSYDLPGDAECSISVDGIEDEKLTVTDQ